MIIPGQWVPGQTPIKGQLKLDGLILSIWTGDMWVEMTAENSAFIIIEAALAEAGWDNDKIITLTKYIKT